MMNDTHSHGTRMSTIDCQACVIRPGCSSKLTINHGDLVLNPDIDNCETRPEPFVAKVQLTPSLQKSLSPYHHLVQSLTCILTARYVSLS